VTEKSKPQSDQQSNVVRMIKKMQESPGAVATLAALIEAERTKAGKLKRQHAYHVFANKLCGYPLGDIFIKEALDHHKFVVITDPAKQKILCELLDGDVIKEIDNQCLKSTVHHAALSLMANKPSQEQIDFLFTEKDCDSVAKEVLNIFLSFNQNKVKPFRFKSDPGYCYARLGFDPAPGPTPRFDMIRDSLTSPEMFDCLRWFIGDLFREGKPAEKILWIYGKGGNGKGSLLDMLKSVFSSAYITLPKMDKFWIAALVGKRICVGDDLSDTRLLEDDDIKTLSGGHEASVRRMGQVAVNMPLPVSFIFTSNELPHFSGKPAQKRRLIYAAFHDRPGEEDPTFKPDLVREASAIIYDCLAYRAAHDTHPKQDLSALEDESNSDLVSLLDDRRLIYGKGYKTDVNDFWDLIGKGLPIKKDKKSDIIRLLKNKPFNVEKIRCHCSERKRPVWQFVGVKIKRY